MPTSYCNSTTNDESECRYVQEAEREIELLRNAVRTARGQLAYIHGYLESLAERHPQVAGHAVVYVRRALHELREAMGDATQ